MDDFCKVPDLSFFALVKLVKEAECARVRDSLRRARLLGVSRLYGASSSVVVFPRRRLVTVLISRFRRDMPWRCLRRRFLRR